MVYSKKKQNIYREIGPYLALGWQMAVTVILFVILGVWLDDKFGTKPLLTIILSLSGSGLSIYNFIKTVLELTKKKKK